VKLFLFLLMVGSLATAQESIRVTLTADVSSKLPTGSAVSAVGDDGKIYNAFLTTHPARRFLRRGSLQLRFDPPMEVVSVEAKRERVDSEGAVHASRTRQVIGLVSAAAAAEAFDDWVIDPAFTASGKEHKAGYWYAADAAVFLIVAGVQKGGEAKLKSGTVIQLRPLSEGKVKLEAPNPGTVNRSHW
jgi:hypothetical protein